MGNSQSKTPDSGAASPASHESKAPSSRRDRDNPRNLIHSQAQRTAAAAAEPSLAQARGTTTHRRRNSHAVTSAQVNHQSPIDRVSPPNERVKSGAEEVKEDKSNIRDQPSKPVDVPAPATSLDSSSLQSHSHSHSYSIEPSLLSNTLDMASHLQRPPRLPLPIQEEVHTPGSPIIVPADLGLDAPILDIGSGELGGLDRHASTLSNTTIDGEDADELNIDTTGARVPTLFEWKRGGERAYVTGSIVQWNRKQRMHPVPGKPGHFRVTFPVAPGTHHVRFIIDNISQCSQDMPTTVDFGNNLVNYVEISAEDLQQSPSTTVSPNTSTPSEVIKPAIESAKTEEKTESATPAAGTTEPAKAQKPTSKNKAVIPSSLYFPHVPQYLLDLDKAEDSAQYQYAAAAIEKLPTPPSLPGFMGKPILNVPTPLKDDNSVLTMPNHTVLNHLATSSIKNNVLAVSATTRYKRKYVTTIMYKPASTTD